MPARCSTACCCVVVLVRTNTPRKAPDPSETKSNLADKRMASNAARWLPVTDVICGSESSRPIRRKPPGFTLEHRNGSRSSVSGLRMNSACRRTESAAAASSGEVEAAAGLVGPGAPERGDSRDVPALAAGESGGGPPLWGEDADGVGGAMCGGDAMCGGGGWAPR